MKQILIVCIAVLGLVACERDAKVASYNLSKAADMFEINRRIVFLNGITDSVLLEMEGRCSIEDQKIQLEVTCKLGPNQYVKNFLGLSDNISYVVEQLQTVDVNVYHYRRIFKPQAVIPDIDFRGDWDAFVNEDVYGDQD